MATVIEVEVPTDDFALEETLTALPDVDLEIERVVAGDPEQITPYVWARANDFEALEAAFEVDLAERNSLHPVRSLASNENNDGGT